VYLLGRVGLIQVLDLMGKYLAIAVLSLATCGGCVSWPAKPQICFTAKAPALPYSAIDLKALASVKSRFRRDCGRPGIECNLDLRHTATGEIEVTAFRALVSGDPPQCSRLDGGFETYVFSPKGKYIRVVLGL
jgi:hypothetical protein